MANSSKARLPEDKGLVAPKRPDLFFMQDYPEIVRIREGASQVIVGEVSQPMKNRAWWSNVRSALAVESENYNDAVTATLQRIFWTAPILAAGNLLASLAFWLQEEPVDATEILWRSLIVKVNLLVSMVSLIIFFVSWLMKRQSSIRVQRVFIYVVIAFVLSSGLCITLIDHLVMPGITPLVISVTIVGTFYYLTPKQAILVFLLSFAAFRTAFSVLEMSSANLQSSALVNGLVVNAMGLALSWVNWQHFQRTKRQERTIEEQQASLRKMAYHDYLTQLPNRHFLDELMQKEVDLVRCTGANCCIIICDIDHFKNVNDTYGHLAGDDLLRAFGQLLQENIRSGSTLVRLGGEEFVILAPNTSLKQGAIAAERLRDLVEKHTFYLEQNAVKITASFGVATLTGTEEARDYYHRADRALYTAKNRGRNQVGVAS